ncbi:MAG TPA: FtsX-like permease family protein [Anaerolineae bacterium]|nr:FtsX-like permease family protein [Anaerolineae bacterium]
MIIKYIFKNFSRRKVRTLLMLLSLIVSTGLIIAMSATVETVRQSNVDLIASAVGRYDLSISKKDTSSDPFIEIDDTTQTILAADDRITAVYPRYQPTIEMDINGELANGYMLALDSATDDVGFITVIDGQYDLTNNQIAVLETTALSFNLNPGDTLLVSYSYPLPREQGQPATAGASERRTSEQFTISGIVRQDGVAGGDVTNGFLIDINTVQQWLGLPNQADRLIATIDPSLYETNNAEVAALRVRDVLQAVQAQLGPNYTYNMSKAAILDGSAQGFLVLQAIINTYGLISLGVVGLLVYTLVMTNVQEQKRELAVLRILGGQRNFLFQLVIFEVLIMGIIGLFFGIILGQLITQNLIVPLIESQMASVGINSPLTPELSLRAVLPATIASALVLFLSSLKPAQEAASTKVMHAINPGAADNIQIEDLTKLRERRPDFKMFLAGMALLTVFALLATFEALAAFGGPAVEAVFVLLALGLLVLGLGLVFFITTIPFEWAVLRLVGLVMPRLTYFAKRNVGRGRTRNTLIALLVLFSGVLPSFIATQTALQNANFENNTRQSLGAPANIEIFRFFRQSDSDSNEGWLDPAFRQEELATVPGVDQTVGLTYGYNTNIADTVGFRTAPITLHGVDGDLSQVLYRDLMDWSAGNPDILQQLTSWDASGVVISAGLAEHLAVNAGDTIVITAEGLDHRLNLPIIGIARKLPGFNNIGRGRIGAQSGSQVLVSMGTFREAITPITDPLPPLDEPLIETIKFTLDPNTDANKVAETISDRYRQEHNLWTRLFEVELENNLRGQQMQAVFLLVLTLISFTTAVFGVFAVIYVNIYARRLEIGMMKAIGMKRRELTGMLIIEATVMTLGSALAGITAGSSIGYITVYGQRFLEEQSTVFAVDTTVVPFIVIVVVLASMLGATFSARRIVKKPAVEILRM